MACTNMSGSGNGDQFRFLTILPHISYLFKGRETSIGVMMDKFRIESWFINNSGTCSGDPKYFRLLYKDETGFRY